MADFTYRQVQGYTLRSLLADRLAFSKQGQSKAGRVGKCNRQLFRLRTLDFELRNVLAEVNASYPTYYSSTDRMLGLLFHLFENPQSQQSLQ
jgi:hypothetical protein